MKKITFILLTGLLFGGTLLYAVPTVQAANKLCLDPFCGAYGNLTNTGLGNNDPVTTSSQIINFFLQILGMITLLLMVYAGWIWVWARGSEEEISRAKEIIKGCILGLIVIFASYGIMNWVFYYFLKISNAA